MVQWDGIGLTLSYPALLHDDDDSYSMDELNFARLEMREMCSREHYNITIHK